MANFFYRTNEDIGLIIACSGIEVPDQAIKPGWTLCQFLPIDETSDKTELGHRYRMRSMASDTSFLPKFVAKPIEILGKNSVSGLRCQSF